MVKHVTGGYKVIYHPDGPEGPAQEIVFTPPFRRVSMTHDLEKIMGVKFPPTDSYDSDGKPLRSSAVNPHHISTDTIDGSTATPANVKQYNSTLLMMKCNWIIDAAHFEAVQIISQPIAT